MEKNKLIKIIISVYFAVIILVSVMHLIVDLDNKKNDKIKSVKELSHILTPVLIESIKKNNYIRVKEVTESFFKKEFITKILVFDSENNKFSESKKINKSDNYLFFHTSLKTNEGPLGKLAFFSDRPLVFYGLLESIGKIVVFFIINLVLLFVFIKYYLEKKIINYIDAFWRTKQIVFSVNSDLKIEESLSGYNEEFFKKDIVGEDIFKFLYQGVQKESMAFKDITTGWSLAFHHDELQFNMVKEKFGEKISFNEEKKFNALYIPMFDKRKKVSKVVCVLQDFTESECLIKSLKDGHREYTLIQEIFNSENKKRISQNLERSLRFSIGELDEIISISSELLSGKSLLSKIEKYLQKIKELNPDLEILNKEIISLENEMKFWNYSDPKEELQLDIVEKISFFTLLILKYSKIADKFFNLNLNVTVAIHYKIIERLQNVKNIIRNIFRYVPGLEDLDDKKLKYIIKITKMYPDFEGTMEVISRRSKFVSFLLTAIMEEKLAKQLGDLSYQVNNLPKLDKLDEVTLKENLVIPYKNLVEETKNIEQHFRDSYMKEKNKKAS